MADHCLLTQPLIPPPGRTIALSSASKTDASHVSKPKRMSDSGRLTYGSVCSGIEAATVAWHALGWTPAWFAEIEKFPAAVLLHHWPNVINLGDMTRIAAAVREGRVAAPDLLVGGTPCQAFSIAGLQESLNDPRGQLTLSYVDLANAIDENRESNGLCPAINVWENVPGSLYTKDNAFGHLLAGLAGEAEPFEPGARPEPGSNNRFWRWRKDAGEHYAKWPKSGYVAGRQRRIAWRVLDAQHFGVPQRRRRVFIVASARKDLDPATVLFEFESLQWDSAPRRQTGPETSPAASGSASAKCHQPVRLPVAFGGGNCSGDIDVAACLTAKGQRLDFDVETFAVMSGHDYQVPCVQSDKTHMPGCHQIHESSAFERLAVRRLMPVEWERLQGFPDGFTAIPWKGKPASQTPDAPRYKSLGNSMAVPVMEWLGERIGMAVITAREAAPPPHHSLNAAPVVVRKDKTRPFLKWAGGKFKVIDTLAKFMPAGDRLIEPFVGAGSVFMNLRYPRYLLADVNPDLINLYRQLETFPDKVIDTARQMVENCWGNSYYLGIRKEFNNRDAHAVQHAALFLALNRTCFNGLSRYNASGLFNVGWCKNETPHFPADELAAFVRSCSPAREFMCASFEETISLAGAGDVIFCDPPYEPMPGTNGFTAYARGAFTFEHQKALVDACVSANERGARVVITNSGAPLIRELYSSHGFTVRDFTARRAISRNAATRGNVQDVIAIL